MAYRECYQLLKTISLCPSFSSYKRCSVKFIVLAPDIGTLLKELEILGCYRTLTADSAVNFTSHLIEYYARSPSLLFFFFLFVLKYSILIWSRRAYGSFTVLQANSVVWLSAVNSNYSK